MLQATSRKNLASTPPTRHLAEPLQPGLDRRSTNTVFVGVSPDKWHTHTSIAFVPPPHQRTTSAAIAHKRNARYTWHVPYIDEPTAEPPSRVLWMAQVKDPNHRHHQDW